MILVLKSLDILLHCLLKPEEVTVLKGILAAPLDLQSFLVLFLIRQLEERGT